MNWNNIPIPETVIFPLLIGIGIEVFLPLKIIQLTTLFIIIALLVLGAGLFLMGWSVVTASKLDVDSPDLLLSTGPYGVSRNPMYVSWLLLHLSALIFMRSVWLLLGFVVALLLTHFLAILPEERYLHEQFGDSFVRYCERVKRYL
jgi:protein-S-isoprenylcysteine O-methyltransferase Ste14